MELHKAIKDIVSQRGERMVSDAQIINFLLDYQAFKEKPATKLILRDVINSGYANEILSLNSHPSGWQTAFLKYEREFVDSCGYKEELVAYVFESIAYGIGLSLSPEEPSIKQNIDIDSFFDINSESENNSVKQPNQVEQQTNVSPTDLYTIALTFYNEGKYKQAKTFIEKSISQYSVTNAPAIQYKLSGDINMKLCCYNEAINDYNNCFNAKAKENKMTIDDLRESLKQHEIKGFENSIFCYYFCLFSLGKLNKTQWLDFVKKEAMCGVNESMLYCVQYGINPMESHINIYFQDIKSLRTGDYLYSDGTFAHEESKDKNLVARVVKTETSQHERSMGWQNGYLIPVQKNKMGYVSSFTSNLLKWSVKKDDLPFPHPHYTIDDINHWDKLKTIESEHFISINDYDNFPAFKLIRDFSVKLPIHNTSPWFLPSVHWFSRNRYISGNIISKLDYWTSSQADCSNAIHIMSWHHPFIKIADKNEEKYVLPIAAF